MYQEQEGEYEEDEDWDYNEIPPDNPEKPTDAQASLMSTPPDDDFEDDLPVGFIEAGGIPAEVELDIF